jgi:hypothetical protein
MRARLRGPAKPDCGRGEDNAANEAEGGDQAPGAQILGGTRAGKDAASLQHAHRGVEAKQQHQYGSPPAANSLCITGHFGQSIELHISEPLARTKSVDPIF